LNQEFNMRTIALALVVSLFTLNAANVLAQEGPSWRKVAGAIPLGSKVKLQTLEGRRVSGTLMRVDDTAVVVKKNTRLPEAAVTVTYDQIANMARDYSGGMSWGKAIGMGLGAGAGAILAILVIALQLD
jgi:hypothetical protein